MQIDLSGSRHTHHMAPTRRPFMTLIPIALLVCGCEAEPDDPLPPAGAIASSATVPAAAGGTIELEDGAKIEFGPGSLANDAEITLRRLGCGGVQQATSMGTCRYAVEGPQSELLDSYQLSLPTHSATSCATQATEDGLVCVRGGVVTDGLITTPAASFGEFAAWSEDAVIPTAACALPNFEPCGGELLGSWSLTNGCGRIDQLTGVSSTGPDPYESCDPLDHYEGAPFSISGGLEFVDDGSYTMSSGFQIMKHELITLGCLESVGETCNPDCSVDGEVCECLFVDSEGNGASGDDVWQQDGEGTVVLAGSAHRYCVEGDTLTFEWGPENDRYYTIYTLE